MKIVTSTVVGIEFNSVDLKWKGEFYIVEFTNEYGSVRREAKANGIFSRKPTGDESNEFVQIYSKMFFDFVEKEMSSHQ